MNDLVTHALTEPGESQAIFYSPDDGLVNAATIGGPGTGGSLSLQYGAAVSPLVINLFWDASVATAPAAFKTGVTSAAEYLMGQFIDPVTINISVGWGEVGGTPLSSNAVAQTQTVLLSYNYSAFRGALAVDAASPVDASFVSSLPAVAPVSGTFWASSAQSKALGLTSSAGTLTDGCVGFSSAVPFTFNDSAGVPSGTYDFVGAAVHEISEVMGRLILGGTNLGGVSSYSLLDLTHFSAPGIRVFSPNTPGYASADGGGSSLGQLNPGGGDGGDWAISVPNDSFDAFSSSGVVNGVSGNDLRLLDLLGWTTPAPNPTPLPSSAPVAGPDTIVVNASASLAGGVGAHFDLVVDGAMVGNATVSSTTTQAYSFNITLAGGSSAAHDIQVLFDNDAVINGQDRNLYLQSIAVDGQITAATDQHEVYHATGSASTGFGPGDLASNGNMYWQGAAEFNLPADVAAPNPTPVPSSTPNPVPSSAPAPGPDTIVVNASASLAGGVGAHFNLVVDGATIGNATVNSTTTQAYSFDTTLAGGSSAAHDVQVLFDNDAVINGQDRNLYLRSISIDGQTTAATDSHEVYHATGTAGTGFGPGDLASNGNMYWQGATEFNLSAPVAAANQTPVPSPTPNPVPSSAPAHGPDTIVVNASASLAGGLGAHFNLVVDGATVGNATVNSTTTQAYSFDTTLAGGSSAAHDVQVLFDNDAVINGQDRNLYLRSISIDGQTTAATDSHEVYHATGTASTGFGPGNLASNGNMYWQGAAEFSFPAMLR